MKKPKNNKNNDKNARFHLQEKLYLTKKNW